ncbi:MAG TPA: hypothetical protein ENK43_12070, partial [Planctomycetes bacterium]|nr:hypothetical protein [Planctomycetota bacterium]
MTKSSRALRGVVLAVVVLLALVISYLWGPERDDARRLPTSETPPRGSPVRRSPREEGPSSGEPVPSDAGTAVDAAAVTLRFVDEEGNRVRVRRVVARNAGGLVEWFRKSPASKSWVSRLVPGEWDLAVQPGSSIWIRQPLRVQGPTERTLVLTIPGRTVRLSVVDESGRPVRETCRLRLRKAPSAARGRVEWNAMASWANAWPAEWMAGSAGGVRRRFEGPETDLSVRCGRRHLLEVDSASGLRGRVWFRIASPRDEMHRLDLVLRRDQARTFRVLEPHRIEKGWALVLLSGGDWTRPEWKKAIDPRGEARIEGFRPFIGENRAWLVSAETPGLPLGIASLPDLGSEDWQSGDPVVLRFSGVAEESWTWAGPSADKARLSFRVLHRKDDGRRFRVGTELGEIPWARALDLPEWLSSDEDWTVSLVRESGEKNLVAIDRAARRLSIAPSRIIRVVCVDDRGHPVPGVEVRFRPTNIAPSPGAVALASWWTDSAGECAVQVGVEGGVLDVRHPGYTDRAVDVPFDVEGDPFTITLEPLGLARMTVRWSDASPLPLDGDIQFTPSSNRSHVAAHGPGRASLAGGWALIPLDGGPGPHRVRITLEDEDVEFSRVVALAPSSVEIVLAPPVPAEVPVTGLDEIRANLSLIVKYGSPGGWRVRSAGSVRGGLARLLIPRDPNARVTVEVRLRRSTTSLRDLMFSDLLQRRRMTVRELLRGLTLGSLSPGTIKVTTSSESATLILRSRIGSSLRRVPANERHLVPLPWGEGRWEATVNGSLPFELKAGDVVDLREFAVPDRIRFGPVLADLLGPGDATLTLSFRFFENVGIDLGSARLPPVKSGQTLRGMMRTAALSSSIPVTARRVGRVFEIRV